MRFKQYVNQSTLDIEQFKLDTAFFFEQIKKYPGLLKHGSKSLPTNFSISEFKEREGPRDSPNVLHQQVNELFKKKFGFPYRNGLFASGSWSQAANYGAVGMLFPVGKFEWLCSSDIADLTGHFEMKMDHIKHVDKEMDYDARSEMAVEQIIKELDKDVKWYHNEDLAFCIGLKTEIMIKCDKFYIMDEQGYAFRQVSDYMRELEDQHAKERYANK